MSTLVSYQLNDSVAWRTF